VLASKVAVVGHVEWVQFGHVAHLPRAGEVAHATRAFEEPAGGGAVAAVQLARLAGSSTLYTVLGEDDQGARSLARLGELGVDVEVQRAAAGGEHEHDGAHEHDGEHEHGEHEHDGAHETGLPTRRAVTLIDDGGERTITTFGVRLDPAGASLRRSWREHGELDAVYFTAGDLDALRLAREHARVLVASPRARHALGEGVPIDALVLSDDDEIELREARRTRADAELVVYTQGAAGGRYRYRDGREGRFAAVPPPGPIVDAYGCGDSFAAGFAYALGAGLALEQALALAARCGAECLTGAGPYARQLTAAQLAEQQT